MTKHDKTGEVGESMKNNAEAEKVKGIIGVLKTHTIVAISSSN